MPDHRRRALLALAAALPAWGVLRSDITLRDRLLALVPRPASAIPIGKAYLAAHGAEAGRLTDLIAARLGQPVDDASLRRRVHEMVAEDFADGRVAMVDGWCLAETEARLCALAASRRG